MNRKPNPRFKEIHQALSEIDTFTSHESIWGRIEYIRKHLHMLEDEYHEGTVNESS